MNAISIAIPAHGRLKQSSEEISPAAWGETNAHAMLAAELAAINPKVAAGYIPSGTNFARANHSHKFARLTRQEESTETRNAMWWTRQRLARRRSTP